MRCRLICLSMVSALLSAPSAFAQTLCRPTETVQGCWDRLAQEITGSAAITSAVSAQADVAKKTETGIADLNGLSSSVKDFAPLLQLAGVLGAVQKDETTGAVSIAVNSRFLSPSGKWTEDPSVQVKAVVETAPKLFDQLKRQLPGENRDALEKQLLGAKTDAENVTLQGSYNFTSRRLGRNFKQHSALLNVLFQEAVTGSIAKERNTRVALTRELIKVLGPEVSLDETLWNRIPLATRIAAEDVLLKAVQSDIALDVAFAAGIKDPGINLFGQLVNNQPQLTITAYRNWRDDLFGPNLFSGRITYEMGLGNNLNTFFDRFDARQCAKQAAECLAEYSAFVKNADVKASIKAGSRLTIYAEFVNNGEYRFTNVAPVLDLTVAKGTSYAFGLDFGRLLGVDDSGAAHGRVDGSVRYERPADNAADTRFVGSLTITKKLGDIAIPFGLVYANKPKFLTGVDEGLGANVGLKFNLFPNLR